jgi:hypothetical protein
LHKPGNGRREPIIPAGGKDMKQFTILSYYVNKDKTGIRDTDSIDEVRTAVLLNRINGAAETMVFTNPGAKLIYYRPANGKATVDTWKLSRYA